MYVINDETIGNIETRRNIRFYAGALFVAIVISGISTLPVLFLGTIGIPFSIISALTLTLLWHECWKALFLPGLAVVVAMFFLPQVGHRHEPARRIQCLNNIRQLVLAIHNYQAANLRFPPPYSTDEDGKPLHSWRVLLLPYLEAGDLYEDLDLEKPWDHPDNLKHAIRMPDVFRCSNAPKKTDVATTAYLAVMGSQTIWRPGVATSFESVSDGSSDTIAIIESEDYRQHWMKPVDILCEDIGLESESEDRNLISSHHSGGGNVALIDGSARFISDTLPLETLKAMLTIDGQEAISVDSLW